MSALLPCTFIFGSDDFLVQQKATSWLKTKHPGLEPERIDGAVNNLTELEGVVQHLRQSCQNLSLFSAQQVVWLKNINFYGENRTGKSDSGKEMLSEIQAILAQVDTSCVSLMMSASPVDKRTKHFKWLEKNIACISVGAKDPEEACLRLVADFCKENDIKIAPKVQLMLVNKTGQSPRMLNQELDKINTYLEGKEKVITLALLELLVSDFGDTDFFEMSEAFFSLDLSWALRALDNYFFNNKEARPLLSSLQNKGRLLLQIKALCEFSQSYSIGQEALNRAKPAFESSFAGALPKSSFNLFSQNPWYVQRLSKLAQKISLAKLMGFQQAFMHCFEECIASPSDQKSAIQHLLIQQLS